MVGCMVSSVSAPRIVTHGKNAQRDPRRAELSRTMSASMLPPKPRKNRIATHKRKTPKVAQQRKEEPQKTSTPEKAPSIRRGAVEAQSEKPRKEKLPGASSKANDFGYGVPRWSPYWNPTDFKPAVVEPISASYGAFSIAGSSSAQSPDMQLKENMENQREMRSWAVVDHTWELVGRRPKWANDYAFIGLTGDETSTKATGVSAPSRPSEDKIRDYGYGVPSWSPYYRPSLD